MLGLYDEALIQYDELDALFTQFVLNLAVGGIFLFFHHLIYINSRFLKIFLFLYE